MTVRINVKILSLTCSLQSMNNMFNTYNYVYGTVRGIFFLFGTNHVWKSRTGGRGAAFFSNGSPVSEKLNFKSSRNGEGGKLNAAARDSYGAFTAEAFEIFPTMQRKHTS